MNIKKARNMRRNWFTTVEIVENSKNETSKIRLKKSNYMPFRTWIRQVSLEDMSPVGKLAQIIGVAE